MKKLFIFMLGIMSMVSIGMAQTNQTNFSGNNHFFDNWSIGVNGGVQTNLHDWNAPQGAVTNLVIEKGITPVFSLGFEGQVGFNNVANWLHPTQLHTHNGTVVDQVNVFTYGKVNLMNWWGDYKGKPRVFEVSALAGVGYQHHFGNTAAYNCTNKGSLYGTDGWIAKDNLLAKTGLDLAFNLGKEKAWSLNLRPAVVWNVTHNDGFDCRWAVGELTAGVMYHFKSSNGNHFVNKAVLRDEAEIALLTQEINDLREQLAVKPAVIEKVVTVEVPTPTEAIVVNNTAVVAFGFDSFELTCAAKGVLDEISEGSTVSLDAFASFEPKTNEKYNHALTVKRAEVVKEYLENRGVVVDDVHAHGSNDEFGRVVIVTIQ